MKRTTFVKKKWKSRENGGKSKKILFVRGRFYIPLEGKFVPLDREGIEGRLIIAPNGVEGYGRKVYSFP